MKNIEYKDIEEKLREIRRLNAEIDRLNRWSSMIMAAAVGIMICALIITIVKSWG